MIPEKKEIENNFTEDCYCKSCRETEEFCQCKGFNQCHDLFMEHLESIDIEEFLKEHENYRYEIEGREQLAKAIHKHIMGEK